MYLHFKFCENLPSGFKIPCSHFLQKIKKTIKLTILNLERNLKHFRNIVFQHIAR